MPNIKFAFSCELFGGYNGNVNTDNFNSVNEFVNYCVNDLHSYLANRDMYQLQRYLREKTEKKIHPIHVNGHRVIQNMNELNNWNPNQTLYLCDHS